MDSSAHKGIADRSLEGRIRINRQGTEMVAQRSRRVCDEALERTEEQEVSSWPVRKNRRKEGVKGEKRGRGR
jgi:hypothetical protein